jgi:hypothetical protein
MPTPTRTQILGDAVVSTIDTYLRKTPADVIFESNLLFGSLWQADRMPGSIAQRPVFRAPTGRVLRRHAREMWIPVAVGRSTNTMAYNHADELSTSLDDVMTTQRWQYAYYTDFAGISRTEYLENSGAEALIDRMQARTDMVFRTLSEFIENDLWTDNDGITKGLKNVLGLLHLMPQDQAGTDSGSVWNIDRAIYDWQRQNFLGVAGATYGAADGDFSTPLPGATAPNQINGLQAMREFYTTNAGTGGTDPTSAIITTPELFNEFTAAAETIQRITSGREADLGYEIAVWRGIPVSYSGKCPAKTQKWLNLKYWYLLMPPGEDFATEMYDSPPDQAMWKLWRVFLALQWGCERFDRQGTLVFGL